jgi:hypothetical protein
MPVIPVHSVFMVSKRSKRRKQPAKKRTATRTQAPLDTGKVVAEIVHSLAEKKFGTKLSKSSNSKTDGKRR